MRPFLSLAKFRDGICPTHRLHTVGPSSRVSHNCRIGPVRRLRNLCIVRNLRKITPVAKNFCIFLLTGGVVFGNYNHAGSSLELWRWPSPLRSVPIESRPRGHQAIRCKFPLRSVRNRRLAMTSFVDRCVCLELAHTHTRAIARLVV